MTNASLRFIHASDFHLERPLGGMEDVPDPLREIFLEAPFRAAARVFDAALREQVDFVLLAGDILRPMAAGPRALVFLVEQFERLHERNVPIYWATGRSDAATRWTDVLHLPPNVHLFAARQVKRIAYEREGRLRADILGSGAPDGAPLHAAEFRPTHGHLTIALGHGALDGAAPAHGVHYWALGGKHRRQVTSARAPVVHYPGTPQGRSPREAGRHGCTLVQIDEHHLVRTRQIATDVVRWHDERIRLEGAGTRSALERLLVGRAQSLAAASPEIEQVVRWKVEVPARLAGEMRRGKWTHEVLARLRSEFGAHRPGLWSWSLEPERPDGIAEAWYAEETIRGEFLRAMRSFSAHDAEPLDLPRYLTDEHLAGSLGSAVLLEDPQLRRAVLAEATVLGADLLSGEEPGA